MAAVNNYTITFKSLRSGTVYTVSIGGGSGAPVALKGGAQPFVTEEDNDEDMFVPIRTQTGYIRIVDDGKSADGTSLGSGWWKDLIPDTDTSRPVTLTHTENNSTIVDWQGFMQAQDFGNTLCGNPQEREFPIQCVLSVTQGTDINYQQTAIQNFAYLLKQIVDSIPSSQAIMNFMIQGGSDAQAWLLKKIDWQNFVSEDGDGNPTARFTMFQCLEDLCRFWGWTARTKGRTLYLTCADDSTTEPNWLQLDGGSLATMAIGTAAGTTSATFDAITLSGDIFASTNQNEYVQRGHNRALVNVDISAYSDDLFSVLPPAISEDWSKNGFTGDSYTTHEYTNDHTEFENSFVKGETVNGATLNVENLPAIGARTGSESFDVIRIKNAYDENVAVATFETKYQHCFKSGMFSLNGDIYIGGEKVTESDETYTEVGAKKMYLCFGVGVTKSSAKWWDGYSWGVTKKKFIGRICGNDGSIWSQDIPTQGQSFRKLYKGIPTEEFGTAYNLYGKVFVEIYGTDDLEYNSTNKTLDIASFSIGFKRKEDYRIFTYNQKTTFRDGYSYKSSNQNNVRSEFNADCIYGSENSFNFGFGVVLNNYWEYMQAISYNGSTTLERPEQHLANRVTNFWQTSKRRMEIELRSNEVADITPKSTTVIDGTTGYPIAISRDWRDDITKLTILEL